MLDDDGKLKYPPKIRKVESTGKGVPVKESSIPGIVKLEVSEFNTEVSYG